MLNYIWLSLLIVGIVVAVGYDLNDLSEDPYRNNNDIPLELRMDTPGEHAARERRGVVALRVAELAATYGVNQEFSSPEQIELLPVRLVVDEDKTGRLLIDVSQSTFALWREMARLQGGEGDILQGSVGLVAARGTTMNVRFRTDPIRFVAISRVSNEGIFAYAKVAVELAIGLIGIMALWMGIVRIAEQSGLVAKIAAALKPVMTRLFPDVPGDHPAMGAMIMNISANMLGLANAATPLGLKAMDELNKLNRKFGTATDAMCTFLVINTSNVQLIPATVIAIRAAAGSSHPTEIIGPAIVATTISTVVGVVAVKLLAQTRFYKNQLLEK